MLVQERAALEQHNLRWNVDARKYELAFDSEELKKYAFIDSSYLGKEKSCVLAGTETPVDPAKAQEIINNNRLRKEYNPEIGNDVIALLGQVISIGTVFSLATGRS